MTSHIEKEETRRNSPAGTFTVIYNNNNDQPCNFNYSLITSPIMVLRILDIVHTRQVDDREVIMDSGGCAIQMSRLIGDRTRVTTLRRPFNWFAGFLLRSPPHVIALRPVGGQTHKT